MSRAVAVLALLAAFATGHSAIGYPARPYRFGPAAVAVAGGTPHRGASRDRSRPGKARRQARRAAA